MDAAAIRSLYEKHAYAVFRRCRSLLADVDDARDVMQEVFLKVLEQPSLFRGSSRPSTFLFGVATNLSLNRIRAHSARGRAWQTELRRSLEGDRPSSAATASDARLVVRAILEQTDPELAAIALYHYVDGLTQGEIASLVGRSRITVNLRLRRFRELARELTDAP